mmetsp:Transcript_35702/g.102949  ORF Transcript_35702/g.102949 Transcript_35702/m.102949 type:complete len:242 (-) Transcript_35702:4740-5465(-)
MQRDLARPPSRRRAHGPHLALHDALVPHRWHVLGVDMGEPPSPRGPHGHAAGLQGQIAGGPRRHGHHRLQGLRPRSRRLPGLRGVRRGRRRLRPRVHRQAEKVHFRAVRPERRCACVVRGVHRIDLRERLGRGSSVGRQGGGRGDNVPDRGHDGGARDDGFAGDDGGVRGDDGGARGDDGGGHGNDGGDGEQVQQPVGHPRAQGALGPRRERLGEVVLRALRPGRGRVPLQAGVPPRRGDA